MLNGRVILYLRVEAMTTCLDSLGRIPTLKEAEGALIAHALKRAAGNQGVAAQAISASAGMH